MKNKLFSILNNLKNATQGAIAVEFALIAGLIIPTMLFGCVEVVQIVRANMVFEQSVDSFGQMTAVQSNITGVTLRDYCNGASKMMAPVTTSGLKIAIASVTRGASGGVAMDWEVDYACNSTVASTSNTATSIGASQAVSLGSSSVPNVNNSVLVLVANTTYTTSLQKLYPNPFSLSQTILINPRSGTKITCTAC